MSSVKGFLLRAALSDTVNAPARSFFAAPPTQIFSTSGQED